MKTIFAFALSFFALLVACKQEVPVVADTTCNVPEAPIKYSTIYGTIGCDNFLVTRMLENQKGIVIIKGDSAKLGISTQAKVFDIAQIKNNELKIWIDFFKNNYDALYSESCNQDPIAFPIETWKCVAGKINVQITKDKYVPRVPRYPYDISITMVNCLVFQKPDGTKVKIPQTDFLNTKVNWLRL